MDKSPVAIRAITTGQKTKMEEYKKGKIYKSKSSNID